VKQNSAGWVCCSTRSWLRVCIKRCTKGWAS